MSTLREIWILQIKKCDVILMSDYVIVSIRLVQELEMMSTLLCIISVAKG